MQFRVLGPLEVLDEGGAVALGGARQRAALAYLLLHPHRLVTTADLVAALWPHDAPLTAIKVVQNAVSRLRAAICAPGRRDRPPILTRPGGYLFEVPPERIDLTRFYDLAGRGRTEVAAGSWEAAVAVLREALGLWRGPILADLEEIGVDWPELAAVRVRYADAYCDWATASLGLGRHREVISELSPVVEAGKPASWRMRGLLMIALYRGGRQADALDLCRRGRDLHSSRATAELGRIERAILVHDAALNTPGDEFRFTHPRPRNAGPAPTPT